MQHVDSFVRQKSGNSQNHLVSTSTRLMKAETFFEGQNSRLCWLTKSTWTAWLFSSDFHKFKAELEGKIEQKHCGSDLFQSAFRKLLRG